MYMKYPLRHLSIIFIFSVVSIHCSIFDPITRIGNTKNTIQEVPGTNPDDEIPVQLSVRSTSEEVIPGLLGKRPLWNSSGTDDLYIGLIQEKYLIESSFGSSIPFDPSTCDPFIFSKLVYDETIPVSVCPGSYFFALVQRGEAQDFSNYTIISLSATPIEIVTPLSDSIFQLDISKNGIMYILNYTDLVNAHVITAVGEGKNLERTLDGEYDATIDFEEYAGNKSDYSSFVMDIIQETNIYGELDHGLRAESSFTSSIMRGTIDPLSEDNCFRFNLEYRTPWGGNYSCEKMIMLNAPFACFADTLDYDAQGADIIGYVHVIETISGKNCPLMLENQFLNTTGILKLTQKGSIDKNYTEAESLISKVSTPIQVAMDTKTFTVPYDNLKLSSWCYDSHNHFKNMSTKKLQDLLYNAGLSESPAAFELKGEVGVMDGVVSLHFGSHTQTLTLKGNLGYASAWKEVPGDRYKIAFGAYTSESVNDLPLINIYMDVSDTAEDTLPYCVSYIAITNDPLVQKDISTEHPPTGELLKDKLIDVTKWKESAAFTISGDCSAYSDLLNLYNSSTVYVNAQKDTKGYIQLSFKDTNGNTLFQDSRFIGDTYQYNAREGNNLYTIAYTKDYFSYSLRIHDYYTQTNGCNLSLTIASPYQFDYTPLSLSDLHYTAAVVPSTESDYPDYWIDSHCTKEDFQALIGTDTFSEDIILDIYMYAETKTASVVIAINTSDDDVTNDKIIGDSAAITLNSHDILEGKTTYSFENFDSPLTLSLTLSDGTESTGDVSIFGLATIDSQSSTENKQSFFIAYNRYDTIYNNYCSLYVYPSLITKE